MDERARLIRVSAIIVSALVVLLIFNPVTIVQSNERGLRFTLGAISEKVLGQGLHFKAPIIQRIKKIEIRPIEMEVPVEVGSAGAITKDNQTIGASLTVYYVYRQDGLVRMWKDFGKDKIESLVLSAARESFKKVVGQYTIFELPMSQEKVRTAVTLDIRKKLSDYPVGISEFRITNYDWSDEFDKQIQQTMAVAQAVKQKEQELKLTELETQKAVKKAEADKASAIAIAEGEKAATQLRAEAKVMEGEGIRKFNESIRATQDIEIKLRQLEIEKARVAKWNGEYVPTNNYGPIPFQSGKIQGQ